MKKKIVNALLVIMSLGVLTGCGGTGSNPSSPVTGLNPSPIIIDEPGSSAENQPGQNKPGQEEEEIADGLKPNGEFHTIGARVEKDGKMQSWLTGEWKSVDVAKRRSMAVMINNIKVALPQYGISKASIIYEAPVEGRITRMMGIFEDYDDLDHIGSVRSSRDYYIYEAMSFDSIYCNWGLAVPYVQDVINSDRIDNVSVKLLGIDVGADEAFGRIDRGSGYALEHTGYLFIDGYNKAINRLGYEKNYRSTFEKAFEFADDGYLATYLDAPDATRVYPGGTQSNSGGYGKNNPCFEYNPEDRLYYRSEYGQKQIDEMTGEQLAVTNVIFKVCKGAVRDDHDYLWFDVEGSGDAYVFTNGKVIEATWSRTGDTAPTRYFDKLGNEIVLNQGKTWYCCIWEDYADCISWE